MNSNKVILEFVNKEFELIECNIKGISLLYKIMEGNVDVCVVVDNSSNIYFTGGQLESIGLQIERKFLLNGFDKVMLMYMVISNYPERDKLISHYGLNFWLLDTISNKVIIYEDQPENFADIRENIERIMSNKRTKKQIKTERFPIMNLLIIATNILVFIVMELYGSTEDTAFMLNNGAAYGEYIFKNKEYYRLFTCMFIHFGSYHLVNNMLTLLLVGNKVEQILGKVKFLSIYLISGLGASLISASYYYLKSDLVISGGASGAIFGIIGALVMLMLKNKKRISHFMGIQFFFLIVLILYNGFISTKIDTIAHLAGLLFGLIITAVITRKYKSEI